MDLPLQKCGSDQLIKIRIKFQKESLENPRGRPGFSNSEVGGGDVWTSEPHYHHDFIELSLKTPARMFEKCAPLYEKGLSIRDIEEQTGIPKTTVRETLTKLGMILRNPLNGNAKDLDRTQNKRGGHTPYGHAYLDGKLLIDPKEQIIVRKILKLHQSGMSGNAIAAELNRQRIPSRTGKIWRPCVVRRIIKQTNQRE